MGADGGVCWLRVKDEKRFRELVSPLGYDNFDNRRSNAEWYQNNAESGFVYGTYGTDQDRSLLGLYYLLEILKGLDKLKSAITIDQQASRSN